MQSFISSDVVLRWLTKSIVHGYDGYRADCSRVFKLFRQLFATLMSVSPIVCAVGMANSFAAYGVRNGAIQAWSAYRGWYPTYQERIRPRKSFPVQTIRFEGPKMLESSNKPPFRFRLYIYSTPTLIARNHTILRFSPWKKTRHVLAWNTTFITDDTWNTFIWHLI